LPEALSLAGDLTIYGKRQNVLIIREVDGKREFARIDLTQRDLFTSPYYYLRPNDIVYVEPLKGKLTSTSRAVQLAPIAISLLTFLTIITQNILIK
jgi:polysaccharide export outer membrane protein